MTDRIPLPGVGQRLRVTIDAMDEEGRGLATASTPQGDFSIACRGAFPGDRVRLVVEGKVRSQDLVTARMTDLYEDGPLRVPRQCPHRGPCPACPLHGLERSVQLDLKRQRVRDAVADLGDDVDVAEVIAHADGYGTRQRVKLVATGEPGDIRFGLYAPRTHFVVESDRCVYVRPEINAAIAQLKERLNAADVAGQPADANAKPGENENNVTGGGDATSQLLAVIFRAGVDDEANPCVAAVIITTAPLSDAQWQQLVPLVDEGALHSLAERVQATDGSANSLVSGDVTRRSGPETILPVDGGPAVDVDAFCQTDPDLADRMYEMAARFLLGESVVNATRPPISTFEAANDDEVDREAPHTNDPTASPSPPVVGGTLASMTHRRKAPPKLLLDVDVEDAHVPGHFLDAYAGTGGFSQALLWLGAANVFAIEVAGASAKSLDHLDVTPFLGRVEDALPTAADALPPSTTFAGVVADPPRKGLRRDVDALAALGAHRFCLISCDPTALKKDATALVGRGYKLLHVVPVDLFPGTPEIEAVAFFERSDS